MLAQRDAAAVQTEGFVADWDTGHVEMLMDKPEGMSVFQGFLHLRPVGTKLIRQSRGLLQCESVHWRNRALFLTDLCSPYI